MGGLLPILEKRTLVKSSGGIREGNKSNAFFSITLKGRGGRRVWCIIENQELTKAKGKKGREERKKGGNALRSGSEEGSNVLGGGGLSLFH